MAGEIVARAIRLVLFRKADPSHLLPKRTSVHVEDDTCAPRLLCSRSSAPRLYSTPPTAPAISHQLHLSPEPGLPLSSLPHWTSIAANPSPPESLSFGNHQQNPKKQSSFKHAPCQARRQPAQLHNSTTAGQGRRGWYPIAPRSRMHYSLYRL